MSDKKIIATHSGKYHADDLFAVSTLCILLGSENVEIIRTRDEEEIQKADYVVDVGGVYDSATCRFDHHQAGGAGERDNTIPYAAFGLVWKEFGEQLSGGVREARRVEEKLVQPVDAADNGHSLYSLNQEKVPPYTIQAMFQSFSSLLETDASFDELFTEILPLAQKILSREIELARWYVAAEDDVKKIYQEADNKEILMFPKETQYSRDLISNVLCQYPEPVFSVLYREDADMWQTVAIKTEPYTFETRKRFPEEWGGNKTTEELEQLTGIADIVFIHRAGFMAMSRTQEAARALAQVVLKR